MAHQSGWITDNGLFSAVRATDLPGAVINRFVMHYKLSTGGRAGRPVARSLTRLQSMTACLWIIKEELQGRYVKAFLP